MALQHGTENIVTDGYDELVLNLDAANKKSFNSDGVGDTVNAQTAYTTSGTSTFQVPVGITSISAVCVGGGGGGGGNGWNNPFIIRNGNTCIKIPRSTLIFPIIS